MMSTIKKLDEAYFVVKVGNMFVKNCGRIGLELVENEYNAHKFRFEDDFDSREFYKGQVLTTVSFIRKRGFNDIEIIEKRTFIETLTTTLDEMFLLPAEDVENNE